MYRGTGWGAGVAYQAACILLPSRCRKAAVLCETRCPRAQPFLLLREVCRRITLSLVCAFDPALFFFCVFLLGGGTRVERDLILYDRCMAEVVGGRVCCVRPSSGTRNLLPYRRVSGIFKSTNAVGVTFNGTRHFSPRVCHPSVSWFLLGERASSTYSRAGVFEACSLVPRPKDYRKESASVSVGVPFPRLRAGGQAGGRGRAGGGRGRGVRRSPAGRSIFFRADAMRSVCRPPRQSCSSS